MKNLTILEALNCKSEKEKQIHFHENQTQTAVNKIILQLAPLVGREGCVLEEPALEGGKRKKGRKQREKGNARKKNKNRICKFG